MVRTILTAAFVILLATDVQARCFKAKKFEQIAKEKWHERVANIAITRDARQLRVYNNPETGSWTITVVNPDGTECALAAGDRWHTVGGRT